MTKVKKLVFKRRFTTKTKKPYAHFKWVERESKIVNPADGRIVFNQSGLEFPDSWSQNSINIVAQKYFAGTPGSADRESSLKQLISRVSETVRTYGEREGYFESRAEADVFEDELKYILADQRAAFNSPVWFNIGRDDRRQQASACFILSVDDEMESILNWYTEEGRIFKSGSGAGVNLSRIRSSYEGLSGSSGTASGPMSFMRGADSSAGAIKSGGKTRRAAKMVILDVDHPDIEEFISSKAKEERKIRTLSNAGFDMTLNGEDAHSVQYQNANNSVRASDKFMRAVQDGSKWELKAVTSSETIKTVSASELFEQIAQAAWECADPGMQFDTTINKWHTTPNAGRINASNPCSEYMHLDNSACNLASINLLKYLGSDGQFEAADFEHTVEILTLAQEILVGYSQYPTDKIDNNTRAYRQLGLGYANLGALLMAKGLPYDSGQGRALAASITALLSGRGYATSAAIAGRVGPFSGYKDDQDSMQAVLRMHYDALESVDSRAVEGSLYESAKKSWAEAIDLTSKHGIRNAQISVLAPTGTIGLMMDCDTTGIEPDLGLVKYKSLVGGGNMVLVNQTVPRALTTLGYSEQQIQEIVEYIDSNNTIAGAPGFKNEHLDVFACSMGHNVIKGMGHIRMMAAVQPFLSGAISKTVNMPESATVEDVAEIYMESWKMGLKAVAIYRDNCKQAQPLRTQESQPERAESVTLGASSRRDMPRSRSSKTFEFRIASSKGFVTVGEYEDGYPGEIFIRVAKQGSTLAGVMDAFAISVSHGLQYGVPLKSYVKAFRGMLFAPSGLTDDEDIRTATSLVDYIFRKLADMYLSLEDRVELGLADFTELLPDTKSEGSKAALTQEGDPAIIVADNSAPLCSDCGNQTQKSGSCYVCSSCGSTTGCS
ncbi:MAG: vitamin B12-dependent ribonucleotide reductase [Patescibacteria group bacterium]